MFRQLIRNAGLVLLIAVTVGLALAGAGDVDPSFTPYVARLASWSSNAGVRAIEPQPDGKVLIGGGFLVVGGQYRQHIARLNFDGTPDVSFVPPNIYGLTNDTFVSAVGVMPDGKILIAGNFQYVDGLQMRGIARLNADGSADTVFNEVLRTRLWIHTGVINDFEAGPNGQFFAAGECTLGIGPDTTVTRAVYRILADGTYDPTFNSQDLLMAAQKIRLLADGKVLVAGSSPSYFNNTGLARLHPDGYIDFSFSGVHASGIIFDFDVLPNGQILVGGSFTTLNGFAQGRVSRVNSDGSIDLSLMGNNVGAGGDVRTVDRLADGKYLIGGAFTTFNGAARPRLLRMDASGNVDNGFAYGQTNDGTITAAHVFADSRILVGGIGGQWDRIGVLDANGTQQPVNNFVGNTGLVRTMVRQPDGKLLVAGRFDVANGVRRATVARFNEDGTFDTGFVPTGIPSPFNIRRLVLQPDGKILIGAQTGATYRLNPDGSLDTGFSRTYYLTSQQNDLAVLNDGKILIAGDLTLSSADSRKIGRFLSNGQLDPSFTAPEMNGAINRVIVQPDGKILIGGEFTQIGTTVRGRIARLNADGSLDSSFNPIGGANGIVNDIVLQTDGKVVIAGNFTAVNGSSVQAYVGRLNADGVLDAGFTHQANAPVESIRMQSDGRLVIGGQFTIVGGQPRSGLARLNTNGQVDGTFQIGAGANNRVWEVLVQNDGRIVAGGEFGRFNSVPRVSLVRLFAAVASGPKFDYDGDGRADVSVFRPSANRWYRLMSGNGSVAEDGFGLAGDIVAPADFDGDGKTDIAIFRPSNGDWWYLASSTNTQVNIRWGAAGDVPRPADFDGDRLADPIVYRPSENVWYRFGSTGLVSITQFGAIQDKPVIGDFDGDARSDIAVFRPSTGDWWFIESSTGTARVEHWGIASDTPVPADYDGDGRTDLAVYRAADGLWYVRNSSVPAPTISQFGLAADRPVAADYDGDGRADIALFRPSSGIWYILQSTNGLTAAQLGIATDIPTPGAYVP